MVELIKCMSTADLQLPVRREGRVQAPGSESWGYQGLEFLEVQRLALGRTGLGSVYGPIATADIVISRGNRKPDKIYYSPRNITMAIAIEYLLCAKHCDGSFPHVLSHERGSMAQQLACAWVQIPAP